MRFSTITTQAYGKTKKTPKLGHGSGDGDPQGSGDAGPVVVPDRPKH
jgi:hypothetical protein